MQPLAQPPDHPLEQPLEQPLAARVAARDRPGCRRHEGASTGTSPLHTRSVSAATGENAFSDSVSMISFQEISTSGKGSLPDPGRVMFV